MRTMKKNAKHIKAQFCQFKRTQRSGWENGIAYVKYFGLSDIRFIIDADGKKVDSVYDYWLQASPVGYIDTGYFDYAERTNAKHEG